MKICELLSAPEKWTQGQYSKDNDGDGVDDCFCILGAFRQCYGDFTNNKLEKFYHKFEEVTGYLSIVDWNDEPGRTFEEVKEVINKIGM